MRSWPGADAGGGEALPREWLEPGEYIQSVTQHNHQVGHCGSMLKFNLSSGRSITISRSRGNKKTKNVQHFDAPFGHHILNLSFDWSTLPAGSYFFHMWQCSGETYYFKVNSLKHKRLANIL